MNLKQMATRLGISPADLEKLRAKISSNELPGNYRDLEDYLSLQILDAHVEEWQSLMRRLEAKRIKAGATFEGTDAFHTRLRAFIEKL